MNKNAHAVGDLIVFRLGDTEPCKHVVGMVLALGYGGCGNVFFSNVGLKENLYIPWGPSAWIRFPNTEYMYYERHIY